VNITQLLSAGLVCVWLAAAQAQPAVTTVESDGVGASKDLAIADAKRNAVEKGIGTIVASQTLVNNYTIAKDQILSKSSGFVKTYEVISEKQEVDNSFTVKIRANVTEIVDQVVKDQVALDLLLSWLNRPRLMVMVAEDNVGDLTTQVAETEMTRVFLEKNFEMVDKSQIDKIRSSEQAQKAVAGDAAAAAALGAEFGAELVIIGKAKTTIAEGMSQMLGGMSSAQADISARAIRTDTGVIMALSTMHGKGVHIAKSTAGTNSLQQAGKNLSDYLLQEIVKKWSQETSSTMKVQVLITGVDFAGLKKVKDALPTAVTAIKQLSQRSFAGGIARLDLECEGNAEAIANALADASFDGFSLEITGMSANKIDLTYKKSKK
jgi:hypothetical protein